MNRSRHQVITSTGRHHGGPPAFICAFLCISFSTDFCTAFCSFFCTTFCTGICAGFCTFFCLSGQAKRQLKAQGKATPPAGARPPAVILSDQPDSRATLSDSPPRPGWHAVYPAIARLARATNKNSLAGRRKAARVGLPAAPPSGIRPPAAQRQVLPGRDYLAGGASGAGLPSRGGPLRSPWRMCSIFSQRWRSIFACSASKIFCCSGDRVA